MSKDSKGKLIRMTLGQFYQHIDDKARTSRNRTRAPQDGDSRRGTWKGGRLSDRLKSRRDDARGTRRRDGHGPLTAAARVAGSKSSVNLEFNEKTFPLLNDTVVTDTKVYGAWAHGIQSIIAAKDLPDPRIVAEQERCALRAERERERLNRYQDRYSEYSESGSESGSESRLEHEPEPRDLLAPTGMMNVREFSGDEENWDEL